MSDNNRPVVSFCIPVYNNAEAAVKIVQGLLVSDNQDFEVIVSDDASKDNAQELLTQIHDPRFKYYRNEHNLGAHQNWLHSLELGQGEWLYLSMGREILHGDKVGRLIELLEYAGKNNITYLKDGYGPKDKGDIVVYNGVEAMMYFLKVEHPTGDIFNGDIFRKIPAHERKRYFNISDMFPENYVRRDMLLNGKGAFIRSGLHIREDLIPESSPVTSTVESNKDIFDFYFAPQRLVTQHIELIDIILKDFPGIFSKMDYGRYFSRKFRELLYHVSMRWQGWCSNPRASRHYGYSLRHVSNMEMLRNIMKAYKYIKAHMKSEGFYDFSRQIIMYYCMVKVSVKIFLWMPFKKFISKIKNFPHHD